MKTPNHSTGHRQTRTESVLEKALTRIAALQPCPYPALDLRSEPVFLNGPPADEQEPAQAIASGEAEADSESR